MIEIRSPAIPSTRWLWRQGLIAFVLSLAGNLAVLYWAKSRLPFFEPLQVLNVIVWSVGSVLGAAFVYSYILKRSPNPPRTFIIVSLIVLVVSFAPNIVFFWISPGPILGTPTPRGIYTLMFMHVVAAVILVPALLWPPTATWAIADPSTLARALAESGDSTSKSPLAVGFACLFAVAIAAAAYAAYRVPLFVFLFAVGAVLGFFLWLAFPTRVRFADILFPYLLTIAVFVAHLVEERLTNYLPQLLHLTGASAPVKGTLASVILGLSPLSWIAMPFLLRKNYSLGIYFAWTFFIAMGVAEMAHFYYPLMRNQPYGYFPGMGTAVLLGPVAWWGMSRLIRGRSTAVVTSGNGPMQT